MNLYSVFGSCLASSEPFPELRPASGVTPRWTFTTTPELEPARDLAELGAEHIYGDVHARLYRHANGHRIVVDDTGVFDVSADCRAIRWQVKADAWTDFVRAHLLGRVLATSMYLQGHLPLHGSAVAFGTDVVAFLAPKGYGKSSLALALTGRGGRLVTDDTLAVELTTPPMAWPGVHAVRVKTDSIAASGQTHVGVVTREGKTLITDLPDAALMQSPAPLRAVYLLEPVLAEGTAGIPTRRLLPQTLGALSVVAHVKVAGMLGALAAPVLLDRSVTLARTVPVYRLTTPRDLDALSSVAAAVAAWHTEPETGNRVSPQC